MCDMGICIWKTPREHMHCMQLWLNIGQSCLEKIFFLKLKFMSTVLFIIRLRGMVPKLYIVKIFCIDITYFKLIHTVI